jgi:hypothetical protein
MTKRVRHSIAVAFIAIMFGISSKTDAISLATLGFGNTDLHFSC